MNSFQSWLSIAANIGIVAGLILVAFQINQESEIAGTTLQSEYFSNSIDFYQTIVGEDPASSLARAINEPQLLSDRDHVVLFNLYMAEFGKTMREEVTLEPDQPPSESTVARWAGMLNNAYAVAWWELMRETLLSRFIPKHQQAVDALRSQPNYTAIDARTGKQTINRLIAEASMSQAPEM
jgi:hypothetical protein